MNEIYIDAADNATYTQWDKTFSTISSGYILIKAFKHRYLVNDRVVVNGIIKPAVFGSEKPAVF